jgi:hypothetical protein
MALSGRLGAAGVYGLYCQGYPCAAMHLVRHPDGDPLLVARERGARAEGLAPGPEGRLWIWWERSNRIVATRTNKAVTRVGPLEVVAGPPGVRNVSRTAAEGSRGPLDVIVNARTAEGGAMWHTQLLPSLAATAEPSSFSSRQAVAVRVSVTDVGDPVAGARVSASSRTAVTGADGVATLSFPAGTSPGAIRIAVEAPGYKATTTSVRAMPSP